MESTWLINHDIKNSPFSGVDCTLGPTGLAKQTRNAGGKLQVPWIYKAGPFERPNEWPKPEKTDACKRNSTLGNVLYIELNPAQLHFLFSFLSSKFEQL